MNRRRRSDETGNDITTLNRLFGRDLSVGGWVVENRPSRLEKPASQKGRRAVTPDPSIIWALRRRKK